MTLDLRAIRRRAVVARNDAKMMRDLAWRQRMEALAQQLRAGVRR